MDSGEVRNLRISITRHVGQIKVKLIADLA